MQVFLAKHLTWGRVQTALQSSKIQVDAFQKVFLMVYLFFSDVFGAKMGEMHLFAFRSLGYFLFMVQ